MFTKRHNNSGDWALLLLIVILGVVGCVNRASPMPQYERGKLFAEGMVVCETTLVLAQRWYRPNGKPGWAEYYLMQAETTPVEGAREIKPFAVVEYSEEGDFVRAVLDNNRDGRADEEYTDYDTFITKYPTICAGADALPRK